MQHRLQLRRRGLRRGCSLLRPTTMAARREQYWRYPVRLIPGKTSIVTMIINGDASTRGFCGSGYTGSLERNSPTRGGSARERPADARNDTSTLEASQYQSSLPRRRSASGGTGTPASVRRGRPDSALPGGWSHRERRKCHGLTSPRVVVRYTFVTRRSSTLAHGSSQTSSPRRRTARSSWRGERFHEAPRWPGLTEGVNVLTVSV